MPYHFERMIGDEDDHLLVDSNEDVETIPVEEGEWIGVAELREVTGDLELTFLLYSAPHTEDAVVIERNESTTIRDRQGIQTLHFHEPVLIKLPISAKPLGVVAHEVVCLLRLDDLLALVLNEVVEAGILRQLQ